MATVSSTGMATGIDWNSLISAILQQESQPLQRMQEQQAANSKRVTALQSLKSNMTSLSSSLATLGGTSFDARAVSSTDSTNTYVTATAKGASIGSYDLQVTRVATKGKLSPTLGTDGAPTNLAVADPLATPVFSGTSATFAIRGTDGVIKTLTLGSANNSIYGLRDAINALGVADTSTGATALGVTATVVNTGSGTNPYQLILTAKDTGTGTTGGVVTLADVTAGGAVNTLGIAAGSVDSLTAPTTLSGGLASSGTSVAQDALFTVNGVTLTRKTNQVTDAVDGVTFSLKQGGQSTPTTLSVSVDKAAITSAMQDVVSKFNALVKGYKDASVSGGPLANDVSARAFISQVRTALSGVPDGLSSTATFTSSADLGLKTNRDGSLSLDVAVFQAALDRDPEAAKRVFASSGVSTNGAVSFYASGSKTATGPVAFNISSYVSGGAVSGTFTLNGVNYSLTGNDGTLVGTAGTPLEGLILKVAGTGSGTLTLSRGVGQETQDAIAALTAYSTGSLTAVVNSINDQNYRLSQQISAAQIKLDRRQEVLQAQFSQIESLVSQLQSAGQSLAGLA